MKHLFACQIMVLGLTLASFSFFSSNNSPTNISATYRSEQTHFNDTVNRKLWAKGKKIFSSCDNCHNILNEYAGPALVNVDTRHPYNGNRQKLLAYIKNPGVLLVSDPYYIALKEKFGFMMPAFRITSKDLDALLYYINTEARNPNYKDFEPKYDSIRQEKSDTI